MEALYESFKEKKLHMISLTNYVWKKMPFNSGFHSTVVDSEMKNDLVCLFVRFINFPYFGKTENLNYTHVQRFRKK